MSSVADKEQAKRDLSAIGIALLIHLIIGGVFVASHFLFIKDIEEYRGPVLVKLGRVDAPDMETDTLPVAPISSEEEQSSTVEESSENTEKIQSGNPRDTVKPDDSNSEAAVERPVSEDENGDRGDSDTSSEENSSESSTTNEETSTVEAEKLVTVTEGTEEGNAYETTYEASPGTVGRSFGNAIYLYMPVPQFVRIDVFDSIKDDPNLLSRTAEKKRGVLFEYYDLFGEEYILKGQMQPDFDERPQIWSILSEGGYDLKNAEYKEMGLNPLVITFTVDVGDRETSLSNVQIDRSSSIPTIDKAVIYGFQQAVFSNSSDIPVKGRFTYRFD